MLLPLYLLRATGEHIILQPESFENGQSRLTLESNRVALAPIGGRGLSLV